MIIFIIALVILGLLAIAYPITPPEKRSGMVPAMILAGIVVALGLFKILRGWASTGFTGSETIAVLVVGTLLMFVAQRLKKKEEK